MSWPWSELGLDGPSSLEEIRHAYAQRTKETHPEEDPEGFQRLHQAYQLARRLAKRQTGPTEPFLDFPERQPPASTIWEELEEDDPPTPEEEPVTPSPEEPAFSQTNWDYDRILREEAEKDQIKYCREELQKRSGLTNETDQWELVSAAQMHLDSIRSDGVPMSAWLSFLNSDLFASICENTGFILMLEDWLKKDPPLETPALNALLERLHLSPGCVRPRYYALYLLLTEAGAVPPKSAVYYQGKIEKPKSPKRRLFLILMSSCLMIFVITTLVLNSLSSVQNEKRQQQLAQWLSEDLELTVRPLKGNAASDEAASLSFDVKEMPGCLFRANLEGERDLSKNQSGYQTNFHTVALDWHLHQFAKAHSYKLNDSKPADGSDSSINFALEFPLTEAADCIQQLDALYESLEETRWYANSPPKHTLSFVRSGVQYFNFTSTKDSFDVEQITDYCVRTAPEAICAFLLKETGLDLYDFTEEGEGKNIAYENLALFQLEQTIPPQSPDFYFLFATLDTSSKEILQLYAYSDTENILISFPQDAFVEGQSLEDLKKDSVPFYASKSVNVGFPQLYRWSPKPAAPKMVEVPSSVYS